MVMLAKAIAREKIPDYKLILVTDRVDLDDQIYKTFSHCDMVPTRPEAAGSRRSGVKGTKIRVVTTIIDKFEAAVLKGNLRNDSDNIFVLVDESHRGQYGATHDAKGSSECLLYWLYRHAGQEEGKRNHQKFGGLIQPTYSIRKAVEDKADTPILYEGPGCRSSTATRRRIDKWFDRITKGLTDEQKADLKRKFRREEELTKTSERMYEESTFDIATHFLRELQRNQAQGAVRREWEGDRPEVSPTLRGDRAGSPRPEGLHPCDHLAARHP